LCRNEISFYVGSITYRRTLCCHRITVTRIQCPLLVLLGTDGDVGNEKDLEGIKSSIKRLSTRPGRVDTPLIQGADHMYDGQEDHVAQIIANWADTLLSANTKRSGTPKNP